MKARLKRFWPSLIVAACISYIVAAFAVAFAFWIFAPQSPALDGLINTTTLLFPALLLVVLAGVTGPWFSVGAAVLLAAVSLLGTYSLNRKDTRLGFAALIFYAAVSAWLYLNRADFYAAAGMMAMAGAAHR